MASLYKRGKNYYVKYYVGGRAHRQSLQTGSLQLAKEKVRQIESRLARGADNPLPTRTAIPEILDAYIKHIRAVKTPKSAQTDIYYLREAFGEVCEELRCTSRRRTENTRKRKLNPNVDARRRLHVIEANYFEEISTAQVSLFISAMVQARGLAPKTANRYREILCRLFNWAMKERGIRTPGMRNPVASVGRYRERAPKIHFLTMQQISEQLRALAPQQREGRNTPPAPAPKIISIDDRELDRARVRAQLRVMVATYIYAGLRREEALWLQREDIDLKSGPNGMIRIRAKTVNGEHWEPKTKAAVPPSIKA